MAREELSVKHINANGRELAMAAVIADGHKFPNDGQLTRLLIVNGATPLTLTILSAGNQDGLAVGPRTVAIGAGVIMEMGPWPRRYYNQIDGMVHIDYTSVVDGQVNVAMLAASCGMSLDLLTEDAYMLLTETGRSMHE